MRMAAVGLLMLVSCLLPRPAPLAAQRHPSQTALLESLVGDWAFTVRKADGTVFYRGRSSFKATSPDRLDWTEQRSDGTRWAGYLLYDEDQSRFVYGFTAASGELCTVPGHLSGSGTIEFGTEGPCSAYVMDSVLHLQDADHFTYARADGGYVGSYERVTVVASRHTSRP